MYFATETLLPFKWECHESSPHTCICGRCVMLLSMHLMRIPIKLWKGGSIAKCCDSSGGTLVLEVLIALQGLLDAQRLRDRAHVSPSAQTEKLSPANLGAEPPASQSQNSLASLGGTPSPCAHTWLLKWTPFCRPPSTSAFATHKSS